MLPVGRVLLHSGPCGRRDFAVGRDPREVHDPPFCSENPSAQGTWEPQSVQRHEKVMLCSWREEMEPPPTEGRRKSTFLLLQGHNSGGEREPFPIHSPCRESFSHRPPPGWSPKPCRLCSSLYFRPGNLRGVISNDSSLSHRVRPVPDLSDSVTRTLVTQPQRPPWDFLTRHPTK